MAVDDTPFGGWQNNLRFHNEHAELIVTLDVGPRVISYRTAKGDNVFKNFGEQLGGRGEGEWKSRGGHRIWIAPEHEVLSYIPDNAPAEHRVISDDEVEALGPLEQVQPGGFTGHTEHWQLFDRVDEPPPDDEEALAAWIAPWLARAGLAV